jgi:aminoglycoside phosphotransferase (APT) family kinase protein
MSASNKPSSVGWAGLNGLQPGPLHDQIQAVLSTANFAQLERVALLARTQQDKTADTTGLTCTIDPASFAYGFNNIVLEVPFSDGVCWIARIQHSSVDASEARGHAMDLLSEMATMRVVKERTNIPVPQVFAYHVSPSNGVGCPYMLMERLPGRVLGHTSVSEVPPEHLGKVAKQFAHVLHQLQSLTFDRLGRLWRGENGDGPLEVIPVGVDSAASSNPAAPHTSVEWFYMERQKNNRRAMESHPHDPEWTTACSVLKAAVPHIIIEARVRGPFPLCHLDMHHGNLLFDDDYNLTGVLDWSQAQTVPLERLVVSHEYSTYPTSPDEINDSIRAFRALVHEHLQHLEKTDRAADSCSPPRGLLSDFFKFKRAEITHRCTYSFPHRALSDGRVVARLIYGDEVSWDQLVRVYGQREMY